MDYMKKGDYGKTPDYLRKVKAEVEEEKAMVAAVTAAHTRKHNRAQLLPEEERLRVCIAAKQRLWGGSVS